MKTGYHTHLWGNSPFLLHYFFRDGACPPTRMVEGVGVYSFLTQQQNETVRCKMVDRIIHKDTKIVGVTPSLQVGIKCW